MKRHLVKNIAAIGSFCLLLLPPAANCQQPPVFVEVNQSLSETNCTTTGVAVSPNDFVLLTGYFSGQLILGGQQVSDAVDKASQVFVAKFGTGGQLEWLNTAGGSSDDQANAIGVDKDGNVVIAGYFSGSAQFGGETLTSVAAKDMFVARYGVDGSFQWAKSAGMSSDGEASAFGVVMDASGNSYVTGRFLGNGFDGLSKSSFFDIFLVKYNAAGDLLWFKSAGGSYADEGVAVSLDGSGNVIIAGRIKGNVTFRDDTGPVELQGGGGDDIFVAKYDPDGNLLWAKNSGGTGDEQVNGIGVGSDGTIYLTGEFSDFFQFGGTNLSSNGGRDIFIVSYSGSGSEVFGMSRGGIADDRGHAVAVDGSGNFTVFGAFQKWVDFGGGNTVTSKGGSDMFAAGYNAAGNLLFGLSGGGQGDDAALGGVVLGADLLATGTFSSVASFGNHTVATVSQNVDSFAALISDTPPDSVQGVPGDYTGDGRLYLDDAMGILRVLSNVAP
jgi:hypothetical protein